MEAIVPTSNGSVPGDSSKSSNKKTTNKQSFRRKIVVTEVTDNLQFYVQDVNDGPKLDKLMQDLRKEFSSNPPLLGTFQPKKGMKCCAKFSVDGEWYRAIIESLDVTGKDSSSKCAKVMFMDFGNVRNIRMHIKL